MENVAHDGQQRILTVHIRAAVVIALFRLVLKNGPHSSARR